MRRAARVDDNQPEIVAALRQCGCSVQILSMVGQGCPDLMVCKPDGEIVLYEVKDGSKPPSERRLTLDQERWHRGWNSHVYVVNNITEALAAVGVTFAGVA